MLKRKVSRNEAKADAEFLVLNTGKHSILSNLGGLGTLTLLAFKHCYGAYERARNI